MNWDAELAATAPEPVSVDLGGAALLDDVSAFLARFIAYPMAAKPLNASATSAMVYCAGL